MEIDLSEWTDTQPTLIPIGVTISDDDGPIAYVEFTEDKPEAEGE